MESLRLSENDVSPYGVSLIEGSLLFLFVCSISFSAASSPSLILDYQFHRLSDINVLELALSEPH